MSIPGAASPLFIGAAAGAVAGYQIDRSLRFNDDDSAYLNRTPSSAGNRRTFTWSGWVKRGSLGTRQNIFSGGSNATSTHHTYINFMANNTIELETYSSNAMQWKLATDAVFRDCSAWQHIVWAVDTTQSTASDRVKLYINGAQVTSFSSATYPTQNYEGGINAAAPHAIGKYSADFGPDPFDGYLAEINFVDGQALAPTDFGEFDSNSVWQPKEFAGTYGPLVDQSQDWSSGTYSGTTPGSGYEVAKAFNNVGIPGDSFGTGKLWGYYPGSATLTLPAAITLTASSTVELYTWHNTGSSGNITVTCSNGSVAVTPVDNANIASTVVSNPYTTFGASITAITVNSSGSDWTALAGIVVDGKLLVDSDVTVTDNSFYLKFADNSSNAALGKNSAVADDYTPTVGALTTTQATNFYSVSSYPAKNLFDGSTSTIVYGGYDSSSTNSDLVWTPNGSYSASSSLRVYVGYYSTIYVNGVSKATGGQSSANAWVTLSHTGSITSIKFENTSNANIVRASAIEVDGTVVVTTAWTVNNLQAAGSAWDQSQTWSSLGSGTAYNSNYVWGNAFDGVITTSSDVTFGASDATMTWTPSSAITVNTSVTLYVYNPTNGSSYGTRVNGSYITGTNNYNVPVTLTAATLGGQLTSIQLTNSSLVGPYLGGVEVDGVLLVDAGVADTAAPNIDSLIDTPTNYTADSGNNGGNYATLNPINLHSDITLSNGNLQIAKTNNAYRSAFSTIGASSGKWYFEVKPTANANEGMFIGIDQKGEPSRYIGQINGSNGFGWKEEGGFYQNDSNSSYGGSGYATNDIIGVAADLDNGTLTFYKNNTSQGTATSSLPSGTYFFGVSVYHSSTTAEVNYGSRPFAYTPPTGYVSLCTQNLADPTIADGSTAFDVVLYSGTGSSQTVGSLNFSPDLAWMKQRSGSRDHMIHDTVRGDNKALYPSQNYAEASTSGVTFGSTGFTLGTDSHVNQSSNTYAAWTWDAGTSTVSNTDGSITSSVRANPSAGFSIVSYNGDNNAGDTVGHGLSAKPGWILIKNRDDAFTWYVYHSTSGGTKYLRLDTSNAETTGSGAFNNTEPTSSVFSLGQDNAVNDGNKDYIAYCWAPVNQYSAFGSYQGNSSADGTFVYTGMRPKFVLLRNTSRAENWVIYDDLRSDFNAYLAPNTNDAEGSFAQPVFALSNGFQLGDTRQLHNRSGDTYIYAAFAEHPFKTARAR